RRAAVSRAATVSAGPAARPRRSRSDVSARYLHPLRSGRPVQRRLTGLSHRGKEFRRPGAARSIGSAAMAADRHRRTGRRPRRLPQALFGRTMMLVVDVENLWVRYGKLVAVRGINLQIPKGEVFGFIGPNGAGKSSTIKVLATLLREFVGRVRVNGIDVLWRPQLVREKIGYVPDFFGVYEDLTVEEYLHFFAAAYRIERNQRKTIIGDVLELTDLSHKLDA